MRLLNQFSISRLSAHREQIDYSCHSFNVTIFHMSHRFCTAMSLALFAWKRHMLLNFTLSIFERFNRLTTLHMSWIYL
jgi:hypothetical protein